MSKKTKENKEKFKSKIGGQALIEGVMMKGPNTAAMACRLPNGEIDVETWAVKNGKDAPWYKKAPFIRGVVNFISSMVEGYKCIMKSAEKQLTEDDEDEEMTPFEKKLTDLFGENLMQILSVIAMVLGVVIAVLLFKFVPIWITSLINLAVEMSDTVKTVIEGIIKFSIFIGYMGLVGLMKDIRITYEYHGAEHKTIACYEAGEELIPENVRKHTRFHPRCGTSFIFIVIFISILVGMLLPWENIWVRLGLQLAFLPVICGISYEIIRLAGKYSNPFTRAISAPGMWVQRLTTREPNEKQIECAIAALKPCIPENREEDRW